MGDAITGEAEADTFPIGTLKLILCPTRGVHSPAGEVLLEDPAPSTGTVDVALVGEQTQILAASIVDTAGGEFT